MPIKQDKTVFQQLGITFSQSQGLTRDRQIERMVKIDAEADNKNKNTNFQFIIII